MTPGAADSPSEALPTVRRIALAQPLSWLRRGWRDLHACFGPSFLHGLVVAVGGLAVLTLAGACYFVAWLVMARLGAGRGRAMSTPPAG